MGLDRFEVRSSFRPIFKSIKIYQGFGFEAKSTFAVFSGPRGDLYQNLAQYVAVDVSGGGVRKLASNLLKLGRE